jgi:CBS domain-containing protein
MRTVRDMLNSKKSSTVWAVGPKESGFQALKIMGEKKVGALMVMDGEGNAVGILSERDYAGKVALRADTRRIPPSRRS